MTLTNDQNRDLTQVFQDRLLAGERFESIVQARRVASEVLGETVLPGTAIAKATEEVIEQGVVRTAKQLIQQGKAEGRSPVETFEHLIDLYQRQPRLGMRSSTSVLRQQYSTPFPLAYLGSRLAGIDANTTVYEPTAGHGALLLEANPEKATVNEIDDARAADLRRQGYQVTQQDATGYSPVPRSQDVVIANPPFGRRRKAGRAEQFVIGAEATAIRTSQLDHVIVWNALESMKDDGRAVLLIGGEKGSEAYRSDEYNTQQNRGFYYNLYRNYNVTEHFTVDGSLYSRQGAGFPVDVILIAGRGASERALPAADVPKVYGHYDELKEVFDRAVFRESPGLGTPSNRAAGRLLTPPGQLLRGDRPREQNRNPELRGLQVSAESSGDLDDSAVGRGAGDATGGRLSDDSPALNKRSGAGFSPASSRSGVARELRYSAGRQSMAAGLLGAGDRTGELSTTDGARRGESAVDSRGHRESDLGGVAPLFHEDSAALALDTAHNSAVSKEGTMVDEHQHQSGQVPYVPRSQGPRLDTLIPRNMSSAVQSALDRLEGRVGDIDPFVARKLNYPSVSAMHEVLAAEQVDGVALGIDNIEHGNGALVGDQTGVGKGRQMAAMLRYAKETDRIPVFITRDASLYRDMIRDLDDIGVKDFKPFITNGNEKVPLPDGRILKTTPKQHAAELNRFIQQGGFSPEDGYDGVFTTYSQLQTVKGHSTPRREFLNLIAPQSIIVMDEAHEAGGSLQPEAWGNSGPPNRAEFARQLVDQADGVVFSSATAIKRPDVMDLYGRRSGMRAALGSVESLQQALEVGGIPLQQTCTNMLAQDGFYIRRERSYEGVDFSLQTVPVDRESTDNLSRIMGQILQFDVAKQDALKDLDKQLKASAKKVGLDTSTGLAGASSTNFTAIMHNVLDQSLLARKADQMAEAAISSLERGEKPILTVANTMGSFLESYAADADIKVGEAFDGNFSDVLMRYLERSRDVIERDFDGTITRSRLGDAELGPEAVVAFDAAKELIQATDLDLPISPIDHIKQRVEAAGYTFGEITGRQSRLEYDDEGHATYQRRSTHETSKAGKVRVTDGFNSGKTDVLLLNRSGATGISLHASSKFADQHRRHMIVGQPERNITDFMQTLGRAHRTGQVVPPRITLLMGDTPDEKRPAAVLKQKMASLNANTTADRHAGFDTDSIPDFFNIYGSAVVEQLLAEYPEINQRLDYPITVSEEGADSLEDVQADAIAKVTGRLPLLTVAEQETFYELLEQEYTAFVEQQEALGNSVLEAEAVDLDARTLAQVEVMTPQSGVTSAFGAGVQAEVVDVKAQSHPKTQLEVVNEVRENLDLDPVTSVEDHDAAAIDQVSHDYASSLLEKAEQVASQYLAQQTAKLEQRIRDPEKLQTALNKETRRLDKQKMELTKLHRYRLGQTVRLATDNGRIFYGAITQVGKRGRSLEALLEDGQGSQGKGGFGDANPVVASKWEVRVSLADASNREIPIPLSKLNTDRMGAVEVTPVTQTLMGKDIMSQFDEQQTGQREVRQVLRGNLFRAAEKYGKQGHVINATVSGGSIEPMMLLPRGYNIQQELSESPVELPAARNVRQFFEITHREGIIKTSDEQITLKAAENSGEYFLETGKKQKDVYLDQNLIESVGGEFYTVSDRFQVVIDSEDRLEAVVSYIQQGRHQRLEAVTHLDQARELIGETIPEFAWSDSVGEVIEKAGLPPSVDLSNVADVRGRLETLWQPEASKSAEEEVDSPIEPEVPAYRPDPDGPTTISRERSRLLEIFDARDVEGANDIASREDQLEALTDDLGEDARISLIDPEEQAKAIASQETCYPGQSESLQSRPVLDDRQAHFEALFSQYPDLFIRQSDSLFEELQDAPEILYQDGEQDEQFAATEPQVPPPRVAGWRQQSGGPEKHVAQLLEAAGLSEAVMADRAFYLKVENEPFIPLNIERHDEQLILNQRVIKD
ncbi:MAG: strawberry notch C-terminal domain-containing protein, partial [Cyanobacteria bacterium P01_D01_bin.115]